MSDIKPQAALASDGVAVSQAAVPTVCDAGTHHAGAAPDPRSVCVCVWQQEMPRCCCAHVLQATANLPCAASDRWPELVRLSEILDYAFKGEGPVSMATFFLCRYQFLAVRL